MLDNITPLVLDAAAIKSPNLCDRFSETDLVAIGQDCLAGYKLDLESRRDWEMRNEAGMDLALQTVKAKSFPWAGCSNVAFPLVTIAALQSHARSYPTLVTPDLVKAVVAPPDPSGELHSRALRIGSHMSWQCLHEDTCWESEEDIAQFNVAIVGTVFKKSFWSPSLRHSVSETVLAKDLVLNYWATSVEACPRKTHVIPTFRNEIRERVLEGRYWDVSGEGWYLPPIQSITPSQEARDRRHGTYPSQQDATTPIKICEQHVNLDLDCDGYAEPYIVEFEEQTGCVCRIVTRFRSETDVQRVQSGVRKGEIIRIKAAEYFTRKIFIPSPDGSIYGLGFGLFLGPLNHAVNSIVNQLVDAGTMQVASGGFLGRGAKIRSGSTNFSPFEWKRVDAQGDDLRKNIVPLPVNPPSDVLFQLLSLLINYTNRIAGTTDATVGENPGQNTPAQTMQTMVEMGQKIYTGIFKRLWRSMGEEFKKLYELNAIYLPATGAFAGGATKQDYLLPGIQSICPAADPNTTSQAQRQQKATMVKAAAAQTPGYDTVAVERMWLKEMEVDGWEVLYPGKLPPPAVPEKVQVAQINAQLALQQTQSEVQWEQMKLQATLLEEQRVNNAKIQDLLASAEEHLANAQSEAAFAQIGLLNAEISRVKEANALIDTRLGRLLDAAQLHLTHKIEMKKLEAPSGGE